MPYAQQKQGMSGCLKGGLIALAVFAILGVGCAALLAFSADEVVDEQAKREEEILKDAELVDCVVGDAGFMVGNVKVTNNSSERSNYSVDVSFTSPDGSEQLDSASAIVNSLEPGQTANAEALTLTEAPGEFDCKITDVFRFTDEP